MFCCRAYHEMQGTSSQHSRLDLSKTTLERNHACGLCWVCWCFSSAQLTTVHRSAQCDSSILHTELPCLKPLLLVSCHFWPISVPSSLDAYRHISFSTCVRPKNEPTTNQGTLKSPRAGIRWPKVEPGSPPKIKMLRRRRLPRFTQWVDNPFLSVKHSIKTSRNHGLVVDIFIFGCHCAGYLL